VRGVAKFAAGEETSRIGRRSGGNVVLLPEIDVELHFLCKVGLVSPAVKKHMQPSEDFAKFSRWHS
jgi:hypothetical protein